MFPTLSPKTITKIAQILFILSLLVHINQAGVIKKRDLAELETATVTASHEPEQQVAPTILTALKEESGSMKLKLQPVSSSFGVGTSKEFSNNEILTNEAQKQGDFENFKQNLTSISAKEDETGKEQPKEENSKLSPSQKIEFTTEREEPKPVSFTEGIVVKEEEKLSSSKNMEELKPLSSTEGIALKEEEKLSSSKNIEDLNPLSSTEGIVAKEENNIHNNINAKLEDLKPLITTTEFSSNVIEEEKLEKNKEQETEREKEKEAKMESTKLTERFKQLENSHTDVNQDKEEHNENLESFENSLTTQERKPRPPSQILTGLKMETEATTLKSLNDIESHRNNEHLEVELEMQQTTDSKQVVVTEVVTEFVEKHNQKDLKISKNVVTEAPMEFLMKQEHKEDLKISENGLLDQNLNETFIKEPNSKSLDETTENSSDIFSHQSKNKENLTDLTKTSEVSTDMPQVKEEALSSLNAEEKPFTISLNASSSSSKEDHLNSINDGLDREELLKSSKLGNLPETTTKIAEVQDTTFISLKEEASTLSDKNKMEYGRSMFRENDEEELKEFTTLTSSQDNDVITTTTSKPVILSVKDGFKELNKENQEEIKKEGFNEFATESLAKDNKQDNFMENNKESNVGRQFTNEKKPKFINDNSTNAQQMNLPNNAEVWYLASMKCLPKANITMDTAQKQNISSEDIKEAQQNHLQNNTFALNTNSEKNLLDWSLIMKDKELATTARNQNLQLKDEDEEEKSANQLTNEEKLSGLREELLEKEKLTETKETTTPSSSASEQSVTQPSLQSREDMTNIKPFVEKDFVETTTTVIMPNSAILSYPVSDNRTEQDKTVIFVNNHHQETLTSLGEFENNTINNNPHSSQTDIEPNLNEINLTANQTQLKLSDELTTTTTGSPNNVDVGIAAAATTTTSTERALVTSTEATAGNVDMTTLEQNSIELTTLSSLETGKQNASQNDDVVSEQQQNNNVISEESKQNEFDKTGKELGGELQSKTLDNIDLVITTTTSSTTEIPITTFRPTNLAITSSTSIPTTTSTFKQEVDQNGNEIEQNQSILTNALEDSRRNTSKTIETHLSELETTTLETIFASKKPLVEETTTSSSKDDEEEEIIKQQITKLGETTTTTTTTQTTPNGEANKEGEGEEEDVTTIGSPVIGEEKKFEKGNEVETTTVTPKTPVVDIETPKAESSTIKTLTEEDTTETQTSQGKENEQGGKEGREEEEVKKVTEIPTSNETTTMASYPVNTTTTIATTTAKEDEETLIKLLDDTSTTTTTTTTTSTTTTETIPATTTTLNPPTTTTTTTIPLSSSTSSSSSSTTFSPPSPITTKIEEIYKIIHTSTTEAIQTTTSSADILRETTQEQESFTNSLIPISSTTETSKMIATADIGKSLPTLTSIMGGNSGNMYPKNSDGSGETDVNVIIAITVSVIGVVALILLVGFLYIMRKRQKQTSFPNRCRPVSLDEYTIDTGSVGGSMRKSSALRSSKRTYGNLAFDDPSLRHNAMGVHELAKFSQEKLRIFEEFRDVPQITSRLDEVPQGCEDKNRYANVLPLPETRVILQRLNDDDKTEYINANYVTGPKDPPNYYIACQAPLDTTVEDFWRMIWEQQSRVIIQATDLIENGVEKCAEYLPPSVTLDNHSTYGDFQITLQNREVKDKYAISTILLKHVVENTTRELTHYWYKWPEVGVPAEEAPIIAMLLEARSSLISYAIEQANEDKEKSSVATLKSAEEGTANGASPSKDSNGSSANGSNGEINGNISMVPLKKTVRNQGPLTIHCSPGTGRTGTIIACDIAIRSLETPKRMVDVPQIVFYVRRGRASAVLTKEQYEFIYKVANMYAAKISNPTNYN